MPKIITNYLRTQMYKIVCKDTTITETYVGHTTCWTKRKCCHKHSCMAIGNNKYDIYVYQIIRENGGWDNWTMILIEDYPCENKLQAEQRERFWIETLNATLNQSIPTLTRREYYEKNREKCLEYIKNYYNDNIIEKKLNIKNIMKKLKYIKMKK